MGVVIIPHPHPMDPYIPPFRPAPIMRVHVCHRDIEDVAFLRAFLDTGADVTTLAPWGPFVIENQIARLLPQDSIRVGDIEVPAYDLGFSFDGEHWFYPDNLVEYQPNSRLYPGREDILIGRELRWQLKFCCDGPAEVFSLKDPRHC